MAVDIQYLQNARVVLLTFAKSISLEDIDISFNAAYAAMEKASDTGYVIFDVAKTRHIPPNAIAYVSNHRHTPAHHSRCAGAFIISNNMFFRLLTNSFNKIDRKMGGKVRSFDSVENALRAIVAKQPVR
jgi:hypothetical protein